MSADALRPVDLQTRVDPETRVWAAAHLADLPTVTEFDAREAVERGVDASGKPYRKAFVIRCETGAQGRFKIILRDGASLRDYERAKKIIANAKAGHFPDTLWRDQGHGIWTHGAWWGVKDDVEPDDELRPCLDEACVKDMHRWYDAVLDEPCSLEPVWPAYWCSIHAFRFPGGVWEVSAAMHKDPEDGAQGLESIRAVADAYERVQAECERLNAQTEGVAA